MSDPSPPSRSASQLARGTGGDGPVLRPRVVRLVLARAHLLGGVPPFVVEQPSFEAQPPGVAGQMSGAVGDPVARHDG
jgi:hypothetical protein